jgi:hypothetical protein
MISCGASMNVATSPEATCHSMWQWKSQTPATNKCQLVNLNYSYLKVGT